MLNSFYACYKLKHLTLILLVLGLFLSLSTRCVSGHCNYLSVHGSAYSASTGGGTMASMNGDYQISTMICDKMQSWGQIHVNNVDANSIYYVINPDKSTLWVIGRYMCTVPVRAKGQGIYYHPEDVPRGTWLELNPEGHWELNTELYVVCSNASRRDLSGVGCALIALLTAVCCLIC